MFCDFISGWLTGMIGSAVGYPIDTVKVQQQIKGISVLQATKYIYTRRGILGFYQGMMFPALTQGLLNSMFFGVYGPLCDAMVKNRLSSKFNSNPTIREHEDSPETNELASSSEDLPQNQNCSVKPGSSGGFNYSKLPFSKDATVQNFEANYLEVFTAGSIAGMLQIGLSTPIELIKVKLQSQISQQKFKGPLDCSMKIYKAVGLRGFYQGGTAMAARDIPGYGIWVTSYAYFKKELDSRDVPCPTVIAGGLAGTVTWWFVIPFDVIKSRMQADHYKNPIYRSVIDCGMKIVKQHGFIGLYAGFWSASLRAFPVNASIFFAFHVFLEQCNRL